MVGQIASLRGDVIGKILRIVPYAPDEAGASPRLPGQSEKIYPGHGRNAALMARLAVVVEGMDLQPAVVGRVTGRPDDRGYPGASQLQLENRVPDALRI